VPAVTAAAGIEEAARLADQGRFAEAEAICQAHMREHGATAEILYLMGLLRDAAGRLDEAAQYYRKTLYLDRDHREALSHLALLLRKQGDLPGAQLLLARASRAERKGAG
jgi:chemotaxis protein methyltransferase WspC